MLKIRIIPCLDVRDGRVVKGVNYVNLVDAGDPVEQAAHYDSEGADELCFLDISATLEGRRTMLDAVARTAEVCSLPLTVGGGVDSVDAIRALLRAGADKVSINSAAVRRPEFLREAAETFGTQCIVAAIDAKREEWGWGVFTHGGTRASGRDVIAWAGEVESMGAGEILLTSMDRDGTRQGYDLDLLGAVTAGVGVPVIASGGVGSPADMVAGIREGGASAVLAASIFHFGRFTIAEVKAAMAAAGLPVRRGGSKHERSAR